ncbi:hypothetical protein ACIRJS_32755 [Streptomyces sp. NPDC102340]|uniref:hypothetical protein n=1 Tax=unclassified Streptomyces TaxID=2593676 RepID=UPI0038049E8B
MSVRHVIEHALRAYYVDSAEPNAIASDLLAQYDAERDEEKATARGAATATPHVFIEDDRLRALHDAMTAKRGEWRTGDARRALRDAGFKGLGRNTASQFLRALVDRGLASAHGPDDGRFYTLSTSGKDVR